MSNGAFNRLTLGSFGMALTMMVVGCGGGTDEASPDSGTASTPAPESGKSGPPTVKGLGSAAKDRQSDIDSSAGGAAPGTDQNSMREAMANQMGGPPGGQMAGGYVPGYAQEGQGPQGAGAQGQPPASEAGLAMNMNTQGYTGFGGNGNAVLLADNAFTDGGEALTSTGSAGAVAGVGAGAAAVQEDYSSPSKAVETFIGAIQAKDAERISNTVSRYAPEETKNPNFKKFFTVALDKKLSTEDVDSLYEAFSNYQVVNTTLTKTSGSVNVTIGREVKKEGGLPQFERRIMRVHRDGARGWKILDLGNRLVNN